MKSCKWTGQDTYRGEIIPAYMFVATLPYRGYGYKEAIFSMI